MTRRKRIDSISSEIDMVQANSKQIRPPAGIHLFKQAEPRFRAIVGSRERSSWNDHDLEHAVTLANTQLNISVLQKELSKEGDVLENGKPNPKHQICEMLIRRAIALSRMLQVHPGARLGQARETGRRTAREREILKNLEDIYADDPDCLLARPVWLEGEQ